MWKVVQVEPIPHLLNVRHVIRERAMYYKRIAQVETFLLMALLAIFIKHDVYRVFIAIASLMFAYTVVCVCVHGRFLRMFLFVLLSVVVCQLSVTGRKALMDQEFKEQLKEDSTGVFVGDVAHGIKRIIACPRGIKDAIAEAKRDDSYSLLGAMNFRYATMVSLGSFMLICLPLKRRQKISKSER